MCTDIMPITCSGEAQKIWCYATYSYAEKNGAWCSCCYAVCYPWWPVEESYQWPLNKEGLVLFLSNWDQMCSTLSKAFKLWGGCFSVSWFRLTCYIFFSLLQTFPLLSLCFSFCSNMCIFIRHFELFLNVRLWISKYSKNRQANETKIGFIMLEIFKSPGTF